MKKIYCGHYPSKPGEYDTGYGRDCQGMKYCYECCRDLDLVALEERGRLIGYLSGDKKSVTAWNGLPIAHVRFSAIRNFGYRRNQTVVWAVTANGQWLIGQGPGEEMYISCRKIKTPREYR